MECPAQSNSQFGVFGLAFRLDLERQTVALGSDLSVDTVLPTVLVSDEFRLFRRKWQAEFLVLLEQLIQRRRFGGKARRRQAERESAQKDDHGPTNPLRHIHLIDAQGSINQACVAASSILLLTQHSTRCLRILDQP